MPDWTEPDESDTLIAMQNFNLVETAFNVMKFFVPFLFALCFHEFAHGWVAKLRGDNTAQRMGRLTLNPMAHADPMGTFFLPIISLITHVPLFGWAKPVPVDERNLKNPRVDMFWIAAAGPLSNLLLAFIASFGTALFLKFNSEALALQEAGAVQIFDVLRMFVLLNVYLAVFNMIPFHPLDGGKVIARFLPPKINQQLEDMQNVISMILLLLFMSGAIAVISGPANFIAGLFLEFARRVVS
jgi:Zn-dependent protease